MRKSRFPILEFDKEKHSFINPLNITEKYKVFDFPEKVIICFFKEVIDCLLKNNEIKEYLTINGENSYHFYKFVKEDIAIVHGSVGAPACAGQVEEAISFGAKKIMFCGGGGSLDKQVTVGKIIVVDSAIRDEGTSYHYQKPSRDIKTDPLVVNKISEYLNSGDIPHIIGKVWTTDAFYRETKEKIRKRKKEGALLVEMEQAACIAVTKFRNIKYGALIYGGDDLTKEKWDPREWRHKVNIRENLVTYCKELLDII